MRRVRQRLDAQRQQFLRQIRGLEDFGDLLLQPVDDRRGRARRREQPVPGAQFVSRHAGLGNGGQFRRDPRTGRAGHRERPHLAAFRDRQRGGDAGKHDRNLPGDEIGVGGAVALVGHVHHVHPRHGLEQFDGEMRGRAVTGGGDGEHAGPRLRERDEFPDVARGKGRVHDQQQGARCQHRHRREIPRWIEREFPVQARIDGVAGTDEDDGIAVGFGLGGDLRADDAARAATVVHHKSRAQVLREFLRDDAAEVVGAAAGRERHDHAHRTRGILLRHGRNREANGCDRRDQYSGDPELRP